MSDSDSIVWPDAVVPESVPRRVRNSARTRNGRLWLISAFVIAALLTYASMVLLTSRLRQLLASGKQYTAQVLGTDYNLLKRHSFSLVRYRFKAGNQVVEDTCSDSFIPYGVKPSHATLTVTAVPNNPKNHFVGYPTHGDLVSEEFDATVYGDIFLVICFIGWICFEVRRAKEANILRHYYAFPAKVALMTRVSGGSKDWDVQVWIRGFGGPVGLRSIFANTWITRRLDEGQFTTVLSNPADGSDLLFMEEITLVELG